MMVVVVVVTDTDVTARVLVILVVWALGTAVTVAVVQTAPAAWTLIPGLLNGGTRVGQALWRRLQSSGSEAPVVVAVVVGRVMGSQGGSSDCRMRLILILFVYPNTNRSSRCRCLLSIRRMRGWGRWQGGVVMMMC